MRHEPLDDETSDRLLAGAVAPDDVPAAFARLAAMVRDARGPAAPTELGDDGVPSSMAAAVRATRELDLPAPQRKTSMLSKIITVKIAAIGGVALFGATAAAASTGALPTPAQNATSRALDKVGVSVPKANGNGSAKAKANAAKQRGNSEYGHCTAFLAKDKPAEASTSGAPGPSTTTASGKHAAPPFAALIEAHGGTVESTTAYCKGVVAAKKAKPTTTTVAGSTSTSKGRPADAGKPSDPGKPADTGKPESPGKSAEHKPTTTTTVGAGDTTATDAPPNGKGKGKVPSDPGPKAP